MHKYAWNMHKYKSAVNHTNAQLEPYSIEIDRLNKAELKEFVAMDSEPYELIRVLDPKYNEIAETLIDAACYNGSYGGMWV